MSTEDEKWQDPQFRKVVNGIKTEMLKVSSDEVVVHVKFPQGTPKDKRNEFATRLRQEFPQKVRMAFTTPGIEILVKRPKTIDLKIINCEASIDDIHDRIKQVLASDADHINIHLSNISWVNYDDE